MKKENGDEIKKPVSKRWAQAGRSSVRSCLRLKWNAFNVLPHTLRHAVRFKLKWSNIVYSDRTSKDRPAGRYRISWVLFPVICVLKEPASHHIIRPGLFCAHIPSLARSFVVRSLTVNIFFSFCKLIIQYAPLASIQMSVGRNIPYIESFQMRSRNENAGQLLFSSYIIIYRRRRRCLYFSFSSFRSQLFLSFISSICSVSVVIVILSCIILLLLHLIRMGKWAFFHRLFGGV